MATLLHDKIDHVWIMGGSLDASKECLNFGQDPIAAQTVIRALHHKIHVVLDDDSAPALGSEAYKQSMREMAIKIDSPYARIVQSNANVAFWDSMLAFAYCNQDQMSYQSIGIDVDPATGALVQDGSQRVQRVYAIPLESHQLWLGGMMTLEN